MSEIMDYNPDIIEVVDDDGKKYTFEVLDAIESDDGRYLALLPVHETAEALLEDSGELVIVKVGEEYYYPIEDDDEYDFVADAFIERLQDMFDINEE